MNPTERELSETFSAAIRRFIAAADKGRIDHDAVVEAKAAYELKRRLYYGLLRLPIDGNTTMM